MKKRIVSLHPEEPSAATAEGWIDLEAVAELEITSEDPEYPIDSAIEAGGGGKGWRAASPGEQMIRICFSEPRKLKRIHLVFEEQQEDRTQEFVLRWSPSSTAADFREVVRQQYNFSPPGTTREIEDYNVDLDGVTVLELSIVPNTGWGESYASVKELRLA